MRAKDPAAARIKRDLAGIRLVNRKGGSGFHGNAGDARYLCLDADDVGCLPEGLLGGMRIPDFRVERDVRIHIRPDAHRAGLGRVDAFGTGRKHLVLHLDEFGGLPGGRQGFRNHKHDALADETHAIEGKRVVRRHEDGLSVAVGQGYVGRTDCER